MPLLDSFPYPFDRREAQELHRVLCQIYPSTKGAIFMAAKAGLDPSQLFAEQAPFFLWKDVLEAAATAARLRTLVQLARDQNPTNARVPFLDALLASVPAVGEAERRSPDGAPAFLRGVDDVSEPEALLFHDDLTIPIGRVPWLLRALQTLLTAAPAVCRLEVTRAGARQRGTGFRIGPDLLLTNRHVLFLDGQQATGVTAEFGYEDDGQGGGLASSAVACDAAGIVASEADDWGVVRALVALPASIPVLALSKAASPVVGSAAFVIQHPGGERKRLAFVRNQVTLCDDRVVQYLSDTQTGSSGSPVLDDAGRLLALHHAGGRPQEVAGKPPLKKNEGIRISRVVEGLQQAGVNVP